MKFEVEVKPTEDLAKLKKAVSNLFPDARLKFAKAKISGTTDGKNFWELADSQLIKPTVEKGFEQGYIELSKAAALKGHVNIDIGSSIGAILLYK